jgi:2-succinyl-6-hydroxy-2,4-cyclohexadiene-1-carboxylate synthase
MCGMTLASDVWGAGRPLVLLHGFTGSIGTWEPVRTLLGSRHRVVAVDLPGHGRSPAPPRAWRLPDVARAIVTTLDRLDIACAAWLGYSLGGRVALHAAVAHPSRVERLVLESSSPGIADPRERAARAAADEALATRLERHGLAAFVDDWMAQPLFASQRRLDPVARARERTLRLQHSPAGLAAALRTCGAGAQEPLWDCVPALRMPVLLVTGAADCRYRALAAAMAARVPCARVAVVPEAGHAVHLENPVPFWSLVGAFLAEAPTHTLEGGHP